MVHSISSFRPRPSLHSGRHGLPVVSVLLAGLVLLTSPLPASSFVQVSDVEGLFARAMADYQAKAYASASASFQRIADAPLNQRSASSLLMLAKTEFQLDDCDKAMRAGQRLLREFPNSTFADDVHFLLGQCYEKQEKYREASDEYVAILAADSDKRLREQAESRLEYIRRESGEETNLRPARAPSEKSRAKESPPIQSRLRVGVISSLSGEDSETGQEMVRGIELALKESGMTDIGLIVEDSEGDPVTAVLATQKLARQEGLLAIIGPLESMATVGAATQANCEEIVLITPTATDDGLADIGPFIWQLNVPPTLQGGAMAAYAVDELGLRRFAVLAISDPYGQDLAEGFAAEAANHGGVILAREWYFEGTTDFTSQLSHIRQIGLALEQADSLRWAEKISALVATGMIDTSAKDFSPPVDSIDGLFIAAYGEDIPLVTSQMAYHSLRTQSLGAGSWNSEDVLLNGGTSVEGAIFAAPSFWGDRSVQSLHFNELYWEHHGAEPTRVACLGYDAMRLIIDGIRRGAGSSQELRDRLAEVHNFAGASGPIAFAPGKRANSYVVFLTIQSGHIRELK